MKAIVICPDRRAEVAFLGRRTPLALVPILGSPLLSHWLTDLADKGAKVVTVLASDRPNQIRAAVGNGERWGLKIQVLPESTEISVTEAQKRFPEGKIILADRLPALPDKLLFENYQAFFSVLKLWLKQAGTQRVGAREIAPGVWIGLRCKIEATAKLTAPCWLGENVWVRNGAIVGPEVYVEDNAFVDSAAEITSSWIGPRTYVGALTQLSNSLAWADGLLNYTTNSFAEIVDAFLLCDLLGEQGFKRSSSWFGRLSALVIGVITCPILALAWVKNDGSKDLFQKKRAVIPTAVADSKSVREMDYFELAGFRGKWRRWPQLWSIVRGEFTWIGNRPITREQSVQLETEFEQLWLAAPIGLFSLADTFENLDPFSEDVRTHSSFYAVRADDRMDREILLHVILRSSKNN